MHRLPVLALTAVFTLHTASPLVTTAAAQANATLSGIAQSSSGQALVNYQAWLRNVLTAQIVGRTTSSAAGHFTFAGLSAASYVVEMVDTTGQIIGTSGVATVTPGANVAVAVQAASGAAGTGGGVNTALLLTALAGGLGVAAFAYGLTRDEASTSR
jgi:hypothetical protein